MDTDHDRAIDMADLRDFARLMNDSLTDKELIQDPTQTESSHSTVSGDDTKQNTRSSRVIRTALCE
jgi:hypothetical protein